MFYETQICDCIIKFIEKFFFNPRVALSIIFDFAYFIECVNFFRFHATFSTFDSE